jgi:hypothetical protein
MIVRAQPCMAPVLAEGGYPGVPPSPHLHVAYWLSHVEPAERLRRVLRCMCGAPIFSANRVSEHPILEWSIWLGSTAESDHWFAWWCHRWLPGKSAPMRWAWAWGPARPQCVQALLKHFCNLLEHPYLRTPFSALRLRAAQPFPSPDGCWIGT